jgi:glycosyltransferase 2 family protein
MKRSLQIAGWLAATLLLLYFVSRVDGSQLRAAVASASVIWIAIAVLANALILVFWAALWWIVSPRDERPPYRVMFEINAMASALMNTMPFLGGHAAAVVLMIKRARMSREGALSVLALDQLGEGMAKITIFGIVAAFAPIPDWMRIGIATVCIAVGTLFVILLVAAHGHVHLAPAGDARPSVLNRARAFAAVWAERMETLRSVRQSTMALAFAIGTKVAEGAGILAAQHALGVHLTLASTSLVLAAVILGSILPVAPGNVGTYEAGAFLAYRHLGIDPAMATILAVAGHLCFMIPSVGIGYLLGSYRWIRTTRETDLNPA